MAEGQVKSSIIILTYNNWEDTENCLESILKKTNEQDYEIIVIDNASQDGTREYLQDYARRYRNFHIQLNNKNEGFARANNQGVTLANGEYLVFLNNDTVVTPGWLSGLLKYFSDPQVGMVGPVTNSSSNQSRISIDYNSLDDLDAFSKKRSLLYAGQAFDIQVLAFFCVVMRRAVFEKVGPLDERFGLGMFEDDDYATRLRNAGYRILCADDVFIHHSGGKSFLQLEYTYYWQLFRENRKKFEDKWKVKWQPHLFRDEYLREQAIEISEHSLQLQWALLEQKVLVSERDQLLRTLRQQANQYANELNSIYISRSWKLVQMIRHLRSVIVPEGGFREKILLMLIGILNDMRHKLNPEKKTADTISLTTSENLEFPVSKIIDVQDRRVPILIPQFFNFSGDQIYIGGAERYLVKLANLLSTMGYQPVVYQSARESWVREYDGIPVIGLPNRGDLQLLNQLFHDKISPDSLAIYFAFYLAMPKCNLRSIGISHGVYWDANNNQPLIRQQKRLEQILEPVANLSQIVSVDTNTINWIRGLQSYLAKKILYIPNFVDLEQFKILPDERASERLVVLYPRRLYEPRGFWLVKEIVPDFVRTFPQIEFHFVGQAELEAETAVKELINLYPENVNWYTLPFNEMHLAYQAADITIIPTVHSEGTSLSCLEAMAAGNAVIATNVGGLPDLVISGYNGILIEPTSTSLREALNILCQNEPLRHLLAGRAMEVAKSFSIDQWEKKWTKLLKTYLQ